MRLRARLVACTLTCLLLCEAALAELEGRRVADVLDELRAQGLTFIYNTQLLPERLRVLSEPQARGGLELAREVLAPHRLDLSPVAPGVYAVVPSPAGADPATAPVPATLPTTAESMGEVVVQTSRYTLAADAIPSQTFFTQEQVKSLPRLGDETLRALQRLPGIATNGFSSVGPVRGGEPNETAIVLDGLRLYEPFHLKDFLSPVSLLDSRSIEGIEFYSGGFPAVYGDRMSAIIDASSVRPNAASYYELGLSLFHASALAATEFADTRGHVLASARRSNVGDLAHYAENDFGEPRLLRCLRSRRLALRRRPARLLQRPAVARFASTRCDPRERRCPPTGTPMRTPGARSSGTGRSVPPVGSSSRTPTSSTSATGK